MGLTDSFLSPFFQLFREAHPAVQAGILLGLLGVIFLLIFWKVWSYFRRKAQIDKLRNEREEAWRKARESELEASGLRALSDRLQQELDQLQAELGDLREEKGRLEKEIEELKETIEKTEEERDYFRRELQALEQRIEQIERIDSTVWFEQSPLGNSIPPFVFRKDRATRIVSFLNLKGGVGKTTLVANLGAAYARGVLGTRLRVLLVDLDFQGTLSNRCTALTLLEERRRPQDPMNPLSRRTTHLLLDEGFLSQGPRSVLAQLACPVSESDGFAQILVSHDVLERADFRSQAAFVIQRQEVRYFYRQFLHTVEITEKYDLVLIDCPPRITASTINALTSSDFVIIPTSLHPEEIEAVPRTLNWLNRIREGIPTCEVRCEGIVLNRLFRATSRDKLTREETRVLERYEPDIRRMCGERILQSTIPNRQSIAKYAAGDVPFGATEEGRELFGELARELYDRIKTEA